MKKTNKNIETTVVNEQDFSVQIQNRTKNTLKKIEEFAIINEDAYLQAGQWLSSSKLLKEEIKEYWADTKSSAHKTWKSITKKESDMLDRVQQIDDILNPKISSYIKKLEEKRRAEQKKLDDEKEEEHKRLLSQLQKAEQKGNETKADIIQEKIAELESAPNVADLAIDSKLDLNRGGTMAIKSSDWDIEIVDPSALINAIASGKIPLDIIKIEIAKTPAKNWIKKEGISKAPGLLITEKFGVNISTK